MYKILTYLILNTLRTLAHFQLKKNPRAIIIGITGSSGKTSTRLAVVKVLQTLGVVKHSIHANSESGLSLNILGVKLRGYRPWHWLLALLHAFYNLLFFFEKYDYYVAEMGIDSPLPPKNMDYLLSILRPDISIILGASTVHSAGFDNLVQDTNYNRRKAKILSLIAAEKMKLATNLPASATTIINLDSKPLKPYLKKINAKLITYGSDPHSILRITKPQLNNHGFSMSFKYQDQNATLMLVDPFSLEYGSTFAAAIALGLPQGMTLETAVRSLSTYRAPAGRMRLFNTQNQTHLIDSSYNASPSTMLSAIQTLITLSRNHKKIMVLGDMRELGSLTRRLHQDIATAIVPSAAIVILYGPAMQQYVAPYLKRLGLRVYSPQTMADLIKNLQSELSPGAWILVKGSQNQQFLERAVEAILEKKEDAKYLARRGSYWDSLRAKTP